VSFDETGYQLCTCNILNFHQNRIVKFDSPCYRRLQGKISCRAIVEAYLSTTVAIAMLNDDWVTRTGIQDGSVAETEFSL